MASAIEVPAESDPDSSNRRSTHRPRRRVEPPPTRPAPWWRRLTDRILDWTGGKHVPPGRRVKDLADAAAGAVRSTESVRDVLSRFQTHIGFHFRDASLLQQALTHRSWLGATGSDLRTSNERMEFLGDSVLELVVNEFLYRRFPELQEGELTKMKSLLVSRGILCERAREMDLGDYIFLSEAERDSGGCERASILADAFEAVIGAIYLDDGLASARGFIEGRLLHSAHSVLHDHDLTNFKSLLQELVQASYKTYPRYRVSAQSGPDHRRLFTVEVLVRGVRLGEGHGTNKKKAEQAAARDALQQLELGKVTPEDFTPEKA